MCIELEKLVIRNQNAILTNLIARNPDARIKDYWAIIKTQHDPKP